MNFCINCRHYHEDFSVSAWVRGVRDLCGVEGRIDPVDGRRVYRHCEYMRSNMPRVGENPAPYCGPEGKLFEKRGH